jgi:hypothetical protein
MDALATPRDLEELGLGRPALQDMPLAQRRRALRAATGFLAPFLRKRYALPLVPSVDKSNVDASGLTGGATVMWSLGPPSLVQDVLVTLVVKGGATSALVNTAAGAAGSFNSYEQALGPGQTLTIDGITFAFSGTIHDGDTFTYSTAIVQDPGIALAVAMVAARVLLISRGVDAKTEAALKEGFEAALEWAKALGIPGEGELDPAVDRTPNVDEYGPLGVGQDNPYQWLDADRKLP